MLSLPHKSILVFAAHPDDEVLGCGGTIARLLEGGANVHVVFVTPGLAGEKTNRTQARNAARALSPSMKCTFDFIDYPARELDSAKLLDLSAYFTQIINRCQPDLVFTHTLHDLNQDHVAVHRATAVSLRPNSGTFTPRAVLCYEVLLNSRHNSLFNGDAFRPSVFVDIDTFIDRKIAAMEAYTSELRLPPHPRSAIGIELCARSAGLLVGRQYVEAFELLYGVF